MSSTSNKYTNVCLNKGLPRPMSASPKNSLIISLDYFQMELWSGSPECVFTNFLKTFFRNFFVKFFLEKLDSQNILKKSNFIESSFRKSEKKAIKNYLLPY